MIKYILMMRFWEKLIHCILNNFVTDNWQLVINKFSIRIQLVSPMSKEKKEKAIYPNSKHSNQILADVSHTIEKIESLQKNQENLQDIQVRKKVGKNVKSIFGQSYSKRQKTLKILECKFQSSSRDFSEDFEKKVKSRKEFEMSKLNNRIEQLNKRILPGGIKQEQKLQKKLMEIIDIHNKNTKINSKADQFYSFQSSPKSKAAKQKLKQTDYRHSQCEFWERLSKESKLSKSTIDLIRSNRIDILMRKTKDSKEELKLLNRLSSIVQKKTQTSLNTSHSEALIDSKEDKRLAKKRYTFQDTIFHEQQPKPILNSAFYKNNELAQWQVIRYLKQKQKRKKFIHSMSKKFIEDQKAVKIYSLVKGGYPIDKSQVQGQFISLARFNQARSEFATLNWLYNTVQVDLCSKSIKAAKNESPELMENSDHSFKRLVQINQLAEKIPRTQLQNLMKNSKIVI